MSRHSFGQQSCLIPLLSTLVSWSGHFAAQLQQTLYKKNLLPAFDQSDMSTNEAPSFLDSRLIPFSASVLTCCFNLLKFSVSSSVHLQAIDVLSLFLSFSIVSRVSLLRQKVLWFTRPMKPCISLNWVGNLYSVMDSNWLSDGFTPDWDIWKPNISVSSSASANLSLLKTILFDPQNCRYFQTWVNACSSDVAHTCVLSIHLRHVLHVQSFSLFVKHLNTLSGFSTSLSYKSHADLRNLVQILVISRIISHSSSGKNIFLSGILKSSPKIFCQFFNIQTLFFNWAK